MTEAATQPGTVEKEKQIRELYQKKEQKRKINTERIFKVLTIVVVLGSVICFFNFFTFREYCHSKGIYVISPVSLIWTVVGFAFNWFSRKWFEKYTEKWFKRYMHPRNAYFSPKKQQEKLTTIIKLGYDFIFHTAITIFILIFFRNESWFPMCSGGVGSCDAIFTDYPNWPQTLNPTVQIFYLFQLGVNIYLLFELFLQIRNCKSGTYYELVFHHSVTIILILFSVGYNLVAIGIMIMFVHDSSDAVRSICRVISESKYSVQHLTLSKVFAMAYISAWFYMRILVLPFCLMDSIYYAHNSENYPFIYLERYYLMALCCGIYFLQSFWLIFLAASSWSQQKGNVQFKKWHAQQLKKKDLGEEGRQLKKE